MHEYVCILPSLIGPTSCWVFFLTIFWLLTSLSKYLRIFSTWKSYFFSFFLCMHTHQTKAFTLVELIVVISVLAVLSTIAMTQIGNVWSSARDSQRLTDLSSMKSSLEMFRAKSGRLPSPTNGTGITYSGGLLWTQGMFGDNTYRELNSITPKPIDPKYKLEYVYSVANNGSEFELGGILEKKLSMMKKKWWENLFFAFLFPHFQRDSHFWEEADAADGTAVTRISGNYNGVSLKVESGTPKKIQVLAVPTLIDGSIGDATMETSVLALEGKGSLPFGFSGSVVTSSATGTFTPKVAWSGATLPSNSSEVGALIDGLQAAYSGTDAASISQVSSLLSASGSAEITYGNGLLVNVLGGKAVPAGPNPPAGALNCSSPTVSLYAGNGGTGLAWGTALTWNMYYPSWMTFDKSGNLFVRDGNWYIRKVSSDLSAITSYAIAPSNGLTADSAWNLYFGNPNYHVDKIDVAAGHTITELAGQGGLNGNTDGIGGAARFYSPMGVAIDSSGSLYITDSSAHRIRKITYNWVWTVSTIAGSSIGTNDGIGTAATFNKPTGITIDSAGNLYVVDQGSSRIRKIANDGSWTVTTLAGTSAGYADGPGATAKFSGPLGIAVDAAGNVFVTDPTNNRIRKVASDAAHTVTTVAGLATAGYVEGSVTIAKFDYPWGILVDANGNVYVADGNNNRIRKISCL